MLSSTFFGELFRVLNFLWFAVYNAGALVQLAFIRRLEESAGWLISFGALILSTKMIYIYIYIYIYIDR